MRLWKRISIWCQCVTMILKHIEEQNVNHKLQVGFRITITMRMRSRNGNSFSRMLERFLWGMINMNRNRDTNTDINTNFYHSKLPLRRIPRERWQSQEPFAQHCGCPVGSSPAKWPSTWCFQTKKMNIDSWLFLPTIDSQSTKFHSGKWTFFTTKSLTSTPVQKN